MEIKVRNYNPESDYGQVSGLYKDSQTFGGQYDDARDSEERLKILAENKPDCLLVAEINDKIVGTVTLLEDGRTAWLFRFAVQKENEGEITKELFSEAKRILKEKGHEQILVFAPNDGNFDKRYEEIGFNKGNDYTAYWQDI
jgi:hypothetical protein